MCYLYAMREPIKKIMLVDASTLRKSHLFDMLQNSGDVAEFDTPSKAMHALKRGAAVDVAVIYYRVSVTPLIRTLRNKLTKVKIIAFGAPRREVPLGVDLYLTQPILSAELSEAVRRL